MQDSTDADMQMQNSTYDAQTSAHVHDADSGTKLSCPTTKLQIIRISGCIRTYLNRRRAYYSIWSAPHQTPINNTRILEYFSANAI